MEILSFIKIVAIGMGIVGVLGIAASLIFLRTPEKREAYQRRLEAVAGSEQVGVWFGRLMVPMVLFPVFIITFMQPFKLLTFGLYYVLPKQTPWAGKVLSASVWLGLLGAVVGAFLACRWVWTRMASSPSK
jgi:hypothetical protein